MSVVNEERNYTVYTHVNKLNGKKYIGITCRNPPEKRFGKNGKGYKGYFRNAIDKYGWDNFEHIIIGKGLTKEEAEYFEISLIKIWKSTNKKFGYNIENGGNSTGKHSNETKLKISKAKMGEKASYETKQKMSKMKQGGNHPLAKKVICEGKIFDCAKDCADYYGIIHGTMNSWLNCINPMSQKFIDLGLRYLGNEDFIPKKTKEIKGGNNHLSKKVICDNIIYGCIKDCADFYNVSYDNMSSWLRCDRRMPRQYIDLGLKYLEDDNKVYEVQTDSKGVNNSNAKKVVCNNIIYGCIKDCAGYYRLKRRLLNDWLLHPHRMPQKYIDLGLRYYNPELDGDIEQYEQYIKTKVM